MQAKPAAVPVFWLRFRQQLESLLAGQQRHRKGSAFVWHHPAPELRLLRRRSANERQQHHGKSESAPHDCSVSCITASRFAGIDLVNNVSEVWSDWPDYLCTGQGHSWLSMSDVEAALHIHRGDQSSR